jgi:uncharacterized Zn-binding protein involved in type VI secretion
VPTVAVNPPKTPVTKGSMAIAAATVPNVCKMPGPPAPFVPVPLPNIGKSGDTPSGYSTSVKIEGNTVAIKGATFKSMGDIASKGTGGGIVSANTHGPTEFVAPGSLNVKIEGKNVQLLSDAMVNNCGSPPNAATTPGNMQAPAVVLPVLEFDRTEFPEKCANMDKRMPPNKEMKLKRVSRKQLKANRRAALRGVKKAGKGRSLDEFPFASSNRGGKGAAVAPIKKREQNKQGGKMSGFYKKHKIKPGGKEYIVRIV